MSVICPWCGGLEHEVLDWQGVRIVACPAIPNDGHVYDAAVFERASAQARVMVEASGIEKAPPLISGVIPDPRPVDLDLTRAEATALLYAYDIEEYPASNAFGRDAHATLQRAEDKVRRALGLPVR